MPEPDVVPTAPVPRGSVTGVILAGGLGRRMNATALAGTHKGLRILAGRPLAAHVIERLAPQVGTLALNVNRDPDPWRVFGLPIFPDRIEGFAGPLAGLHAGLGFASTPWIVTVPCDAPRLPPDLVDRLAAALVSTHAPAAVARTVRALQPVFAMVSRHAADDLTEYLATGGRRVEAWYARLPAVEVPFEDERAFDNVNTPHDLRRLEDEPAPIGDGSPP